MELLRLNITNLPIKESQKLRLCGYCIKLKGRSRRFVSAYALTYHITHEHKDDIGIVEPVKISQPNMISREIEEID